MMRSTTIGANISRRNFVAGFSAVAAVAPFHSAYAATRVAPGSVPGFILGKGPEGRCDDTKNGGAVVRWNESANKWYMWYYCRNSDFPAEVAPAFGTGSIALATSDDGIRWDRYDGPLKGGAIMEPSPDPDAFDSQHIGSGDITYHNGEWLLWYFGGDATVPKELGGVAVSEGYQFKGYRCRPGVARSKDGITWERIKGKASGGAAVDIGDNIYGAFPSGIYDGERFLLYYSTLSPKVFHWQTHVAASTDLVNWEDLGLLQWENDPALFEVGGSSTRHILRNPLSRRPQWLMLYTALDARFPLYPRSVGAAVSDDALTWRRLYDEPIFHMGARNAWDGGGVSYPQLVPHNGKLHLYYYGFADRMNKQPPLRGIGLAISDSGELTDFRRVTF